jgi:hypothetical protein
MEGEKRARGSKTQSPFALTFKTPRFSNTEKGNKKKKKKKKTLGPLSLSPIGYRHWPTLSGGSRDGGCPMPMSHDDDGEDDHGHVGMDVKRDIFCFFFFFFVYIGWRMCG